MREATAETKRLGAVVGRNLRRLREEQGMSQREFHAELRRRGVPWSYSQLASIESGRREDVGLSTFVLLVAALQTTAADLLECPFPIEVSESLQLGDGRDLYNTLLNSTRRRPPGQEAELPWLDMPEGPREISHAEATAYLNTRANDADRRLASRLGVEPAEVIAAAWKLWGHSLTTERNLETERRWLAGTDSRGTARGHVTRHLGRMIEDVLGIPPDPLADTPWARDAHDEEQS